MTTDTASMRTCSRGSLVASSDRGDIILGWLTRIVVVLGVAGLFLFDAISVGSTAMTLSDQGSHAARTASEVWQETSSVQKSYDAAVALVTEQNPLNTIDPKSFRIDEDNTVRMEVSRTATSILLFRWDRSAEWATVTREVTGRSVG